jgi:DnaJ-class molecular chaperone
MEKNYYKILGLCPTCSTTEICAAYKTLALKTHPQNLSNDRPVKDAVANYRIFSDIAEAFDVLSNQKTRDAYDAHPYQQFLETSYQFMGSPENIFDKFFGTKNFFAALVQDETEYNEYLKRQSKTKIEEPKDIHVTKRVSLLELFKGMTFEVVFDRQLIGKDIMTTKVIPATKRVVLEPGFQCDKPIVFKGEGNQVPCCQNGLVISRFGGQDRSDSREKLPTSGRRPRLPP